MQITLSFGRSISLVRLRQTPTYYGVLAGRPTTRLDLFHIDRVKKEAETLVAAGARPALLKLPKIAPLPCVTCIGVFDSDELKKLGSELYSSAALVWFQDAFSPSIAGYALAEIAALDWEAVAVDWTW